MENLNNGSDFSIYLWDNGITLSHKVVFKLLDFISSILLNKTSREKSLVLLGVEELSLRGMIAFLAVLRAGCIPLQAGTAKLLLSSIIFSNEI